jgi:S1-C subfamily serine protease
MSGSPVFGSKGEVVGIILGREFNQGFEGLSVAIPIQFAKPLLQLAGLT